MTSSTKLCCVSVGSDSLASDNHTAMGKGGGGGSIKPLYFLCMCGFKQVGPEGGKQQEEGRKLQLWIQLGAYPAGVLRGFGLQNFPTTPEAHPRGLYLPPNNCLDSCQSEASSVKYLNSVGLNAPALQTRQSGSKVSLLFLSHHFLPLSINV